MSSSSWQDVETTWKPRRRKGNPSFNCLMAVEARRSRFPIPGRHLPDAPAAYTPFKKSASEVAQSCPTLCDPTDWVAHQAPPSMEFSRQEDWNGLPSPPGDLPDAGMQPGAPTLQTDTLPSEPPLLIDVLPKNVQTTAQVHSSHTLAK